MAKIALGTWAWGAGAFGGDKVFGSKTDVENLKPVFDAAMKAGLSLWLRLSLRGSASAHAEPAAHEAVSHCGSRSCTL
ncbi:MAG: hypothetical protein J6M37_06470 [Prevotella sp.]|nr:hypothetical protein [Prevotella sp.]